MSLKDLLQAGTDAAAAAAAAAALDQITLDAAAEGASGGPAGLLPFDIIECIALALASPAPAPRLAAAALLVQLAAAPLYASQLTAARVLPRVADAADRSATAGAPGEFGAHACAIAAVVRGAVASPEVLEALREMSGAVAWLLHAYWRSPPLAAAAAALLFSAFTCMVEADGDDGALAVPREVVAVIEGALAPPPGPAAAAAASLCAALGGREDLSLIMSAPDLVPAVVRALGAEFPLPARVAAAGAAYALAGDDSGELPERLVAAGAPRALLSLLDYSGGGGASGVANAAGAIMNVAAASEECRAAVAAAVPLASLVAALPPPGPPPHGWEDAVELACGAMVNIIANDAAAIDALAAAGFVAKARGLLGAAGAPSLSPDALEALALLLCRLASRPHARCDVAKLGDVLAAMMQASEDRVGKQACVVVGAVLKQRGGAGDAAATAAAAEALAARGVGTALARVLAEGSSAAVTRAAQILTRMGALIAVSGGGASSSMLSAVRAALHDPARAAAAANVLQAWGAAAVVAADSAGAHMTATAAVKLGAGSGGALAAEIVVPVAHVPGAAVVSVVAVAVGGASVNAGGRTTLEPSPVPATVRAAAAAGDGAAAGAHQQPVAHVAIPGSDSSIAVAATSAAPTVVRHEPALPVVGAGAAILPTAHGGAAPPLDSSSTGRAGPVLPRAAAEAAEADVVVRSSVRAESSASIAVRTLE
jgi:hypothetical protein